MEDIKLDLFEFNNLEENKIFKIKNKSISSKNIKAINTQLLRDINCLDSLKKNGGFPKEGEYKSFQSAGLSDAGSFLYAVVEEFLIIEEAIIATWTISKKNVLKILDYIDNGKINKLIFLINDGMLNTNSTKPIYSFMRLEFDKRKDKILYNVANSHAKIQCYKTSQNYLTISGSGNWSENPRIENYIILGHKKEYEYNKQWISLECFKN